ncbi:YopX protein [Blautia hydrogenotrophica]|jgi:uncharacterized phage protein (TIGR01671 family)|uniref:YopX protein domain-containing protein n=1 Tax=Blautia hydrogenotrophica (strain DSM 10507 / JCM 14656 / S5a33) TaxID=476272 RepID=C0CR24_BLAHS|nr:YopX family protein [Blautia hydrogenotrophica]SCI35013.1 YopX protein [uncultured Blautia sp.]DAU19077.1 MAG TPA: YopX protein [Caudoviricetes sp.]EEG47787.1 phage conserved hypothetical protein TIGR01671 [Blautia hydrogenotrophica DSM 10507]MCT6798115.1 hypothetical protein [Blautia hydrogenotrophica]WPX84200.1 hypothetical protein BLHYD_22100 [Blautia hydrogenotrophica DSM 10507]
MSREILFKAKRKNWRELSQEEWWVEGNFITDEKDDQKAYIGYLFGVVDGVVEDFDIVEINPETLCQYTGLTDKNGKRIWENDIVEHEISSVLGAVEWYAEDYVGWWVNDEYLGKQQFTDEMWDECVVIGNIFDNPELLGGAE